MAGALLLAVMACRGESGALPEPDAVAEYYPTSGDLTVEMNGNVAEVSVQQPGEQLARGGALWAKVGPYIFLFSEGTRDLFADHPALAGVRVITRTGQGREVARALLQRDALNDIGWRRALNLAGRARLEGTERVGLIEELVRWGEEQTTFRYDTDYVP
jgi:hypothetical protein